MASADLSRRVEKVVAYRRPPSWRSGREFHEALLDADSLEGLAGK